MSFLSRTLSFAIAIHTCVNNFKESKERVLRSKVLTGILCVKDGEENGSKFNACPVTGETVVGLQDGLPDRNRK